MTREILAQGEACSWNKDDPELKLLSWNCFAAPPSTKDILEQAFNWLKDSLRFAKNRVMAMMTKFLYLLTSPYASQAGVRVVRPVMSDFQVNLQAGFQKIKTGLFRPKSKDMDTELLPSPDAVTKVRPAGFHANRDASAAMMFALHVQPRGFENLPPAWPGFFDFIIGENGFTI